MNSQALVDVRARRSPASTAQAITPPTVPQFEDRYVTIDDIRLRYWQAGESGPPVLFLHGLNGCIENWRWTLPAVAAQHRVFALDGPGHGLSQPDDRTYNLYFMRDLVAAFVHSQGLARVNLAALSGGGLVALTIALDLPALVDKLVLCDSAGLGRSVSPRMRIFSMLPPPPPSLMNRPMHREDLRHWLQRAFFASPDALSEAMLDDFHANLGRPHTMHTSSRLMRWGVNIFGQKYVFISRLRHIRAPVLLVWGRQDRLIPVRHAERAARLIPDARLSILDPCGHLPMLERPREFNGLLLQFFAA
jgi:4,5:9,10-diseco-3-hydroxy-5,9,17-trioxoandrosta-1(10),2-diene-4-oate hydrolase